MLTESAFLGYITNWTNYTPKDIVAVRFGDETFLTARGSLIDEVTETLGDFPLVQEIMTTNQRKWEELRTNHKQLEWVPLQEYVIASYSTETS